MYNDSMMMIIKIFPFNSFLTVMYFFTLKVWNELFVFRTKIVSNTKKKITLIPEQHYDTSVPSIYPELLVCRHPCDKPKEITRVKVQVGGDDGFSLCGGQ